MRQINNNIHNYLNEIKNIINEIEKDQTDKIKKITEIIYDAYLNNNHIFIMGNGGSAATASHFACDLGKGTLHPNEQSKIKRFKVTSLTDNVASITAWGNDISYEHIFSEQLKNLVSANDVVVGISASGNSTNVINAIKTAKQYKAKTIGLAGFDGGLLVKLTNIAIVAPIHKYDIAEDIHLIICHLITRYFRELLNEEGLLE